MNFRYVLCFCDISTTAKLWIPPVLSTGSGYAHLYWVVLLKTVCILNRKGLEIIWKSTGFGFSVSHHLHAQISLWSKKKPCHWQEVGTLDNFKELEPAEQEMLQPSGQVCCLYQSLLVILFSTWKFPYTGALCGSRSSPVFMPFPTCFLQLRVTIFSISRRKFSQGTPQFPLLPFAFWTLLFIPVLSLLFSFSFRNTKFQATLDLLGIVWELWTTTTLIALEVSIPVCSYVSVTSSGLC